MKLTDAKIEEIWTETARTPNEHGLYYDVFIRFARAILKEAGMEELEKQICRRAQDQVDKATEITELRGAVESSSSEAAHWRHKYYELEAEIGEYIPVAWMSDSEHRLFSYGHSAFVSTYSEPVRSDGIVLYKKSK